MSDAPHHVRPRFERWRPHPWHGLSPGRSPPQFLQVYVETTPFDAVKYELDRQTGYLRVNRLQRGSSLPPALYGFVPRSLCGPRVRALSPGATQGDGDPLDVCVFSERPVRCAEMLLDVRLLGGLEVRDGGCADDKLIAVLEHDPLWGEARGLEDLPPVLLERLSHYFATYKATPEGGSPVLVRGPYGLARAEAVVRAALQDYRAFCSHDRRGRAARRRPSSWPARGAGRRSNASPFKAMPVR
jgi:inorganic pyrophosphatase